MKGLKNKVVFTIGVFSVVDIITNSSSELFVLAGETKSIVEEMIENIYPEYRTEYEELKDIRDMSNQDLDSFLDWHLGLKGNGWSSGKIYNQESDYNMIPGFKFEELYDTSVELGGWNCLKNEYEIMNNKPVDERNNKWDSYFTTDENRERVIKGLEESVGRFFLYSIDENPNWDKQEQLMEIGQRYHLG